jgi:hypothetical protein
MPERSSRLRTSRYLVDLPIFCRYTPKGGHAAKTGSGWTRNLSERGACLELVEPLAPGTSLSLVVQSEGESLTLLAEVVWGSPPSLPGVRILHGVIFSHLTADQETAIQTLLRRTRPLKARAHRIPAALPVQCRPSGMPGPPLSGWTGDLSRNGCSLLLPGRLAMGSTVEVTLAAPRGDCTAEGMIVWVEPSGGVPATPLMRHGVRFTDPNLLRDLIIGFVLEGIRAGTERESGTK